MRAERFDLWLVGSLAVLDAALLLVPYLDGPVRIALGLPLALVLPGYALQAAADPARRLQWAERLVLSLGLTLALIVLAGLVLNLTPAGLRREPWTTLLTIVTLAGCGVAAIRRQRIHDLFVLPGVRSRRVDFLALLGAMGLAGVALVISGASAQQPRIGFSELWLIPPDTGAPTSVGVRSMELAPALFHLQVISGETTVLDSRFNLSPGQTWQTNLDPPDPEKSLDAYIFRDGSNVPYRTAHLAPQSTDAPTT